MYSYGKQRIKKDVLSEGYIIGVPPSKDIFVPSVETGKRIPKPKRQWTYNQIFMHKIKYSDSWDAFSMFIQYFSTKAFNYSSMKFRYISSVVKAECE